MAVSVGRPAAPSLQIHRRYPHLDGLRGGPCEFIVFRVDIYVLRVYCVHTIKNPNSTRRGTMGFTGTKRRVYYYAIALNDEGNIGIMLVIRNGGKQVSDEWTGETFPNTRKGQDAANALMIYRNCL